ncbi:IPT/TIG domain-containing protein [Dactylosporangium roseum]|uniref:IPT/TIG domain-containing protein n=1 Tax=Dactylosporangium roseum TaxID=47989 RepID=A0ABY5Z1M6_9ACTN|nr:IPT/TIG domain-containing protein [Dactylosporangium roseum]UWZ35931.1 IPT/TIG domain-containing protein [Dactylosporangium roseum]
MHVKKLIGGSLGRATAVAGLAAGMLVATAAPAFAGLLTLSNITGPLTGGNTVTASTADGTKPYSSAAVVNVQLQFSAAGTCTPTYQTVNATTGIGGTATAPIIGVGVGTAGGSVTLITASKIAIKMPTFTVAGKYGLCVYSGTTVAATGVTGSPLISNASYSVATPSTATTVSPTTGPAQGGTLVTVTGTAFPTTAGSITASVGGVAMTNVTPINATTFTAITPAHTAGGPFTVSVTTAGGTVQSSGTFTFTNGITVLPNTAPNSANITLDVLGVGFSGLNFASTANSAPDAATFDEANAHVYLVKGQYDPADNSGVKTNGQVIECTDVITVSDSELLCTLKLNNGGTSNAIVPEGTYTVTVVANGSIGATAAQRNQSIISSGATFTVAAYL